MSQNIGLGTERISRLLRAFVLLCIFSLIVFCLYNIVDQIFVGNGIGIWAMPPQASSFRSRSWAGASRCCLATEQPHI
ncbi:hypothetical protein AAK706_13230 [Erysipelotrichaceae bacterium 66-17]